MPCITFLHTSSPYNPLSFLQVAYRVPGAQYADWVDLYNRLYRERILFAGAQIDDQLANSMIGVMLYLDSEDNNKPIYMYINSPGGSVTAGFAMFDTMRHIKSEVSTINVGLAASMGSFLLVGGAKGKRLMLPHARTMIHQPAAGGIQGQAEDIKVEAQQILADRVADQHSAPSLAPPELLSFALARLFPAIIARQPRSKQAPHLFGRCDALRVHDQAFRRS